MQGASLEGWNVTHRLWEVPASWAGNILHRQEGDIGPRPQAPLLGLALVMVLV